VRKENKELWKQNMQQRNQQPSKDEANADEEDQHIFAVRIHTHKERDGVRFTS